MAMSTCAACQHFQPDAISPAAGMGRCMHQARHGYWHPEARHSCPDFENASDGAGNSRDTTIGSPPAASEGNR